MTTPNPTPETGYCPECGSLIARGKCSTPYLHKRPTPDLSKIAWVLEYQARFIPHGKGHGKDSPDPEACLPCAMLFASAHLKNAVNVITETPDHA